jgi:phosphoribosylglycinamide formyltransferase-1
MATLELGILVSGSGSNLQAILDAISQGRLDARVRLVISNRSDALAIERAKRANLPTLVVSHRDFTTREDFDQALADALTQAGAEWVVLAGFMRILTPCFLRVFRRRVLNIHPSLLPAFPGTHAIRQALEHGVQVTGCTVHWVDEGVDSGPVIAQKSVPVEVGDDEASLAERMHRAEHELYVEVLAGLASGQVRAPEGV